MINGLTHADPSAHDKNSTWAARMPPRPVRTCTEHKAALDELMRLGRLMDAGKASKAQTDAVEVLKLLVLDYERRRFGETTRDASPCERLQFLIEESGLSASDLGRLLGDRALGSRLLRGQRQLSKAHILRLAEYFHLDPGYFL